MQMKQDKLRAMQESERKTIQEQLAAAEQKLIADEIKNI